MSHFYLQGFHDVDIMKSLQEIAEKNTVLYKTDFLIDKQIVKQAAESTSLDDKNLIWISKERGTRHFYEFRISNSKYFKQKIITPTRCLNISINDAPMLIPNGSNGDNFQVTRIAIIPEDVPFNSYMLSTFITVEGDIKIYDEKGNIAFHLIGRYEIMFGFSIIAFNKIG